MAKGNTLNYGGEFAAALSHLEQGSALYDPQRRRSHAFGYADDPGVVCRSYAAWTLWVLGYPERALRRNREALTLARESAHPLSLAFALFFAAVVHQFRREGPLLQEYAEATITLSAEHGLTHWWAMGTILRGWALAAQGHGEEGISLKRGGPRSWQWRKSRNWSASPGFEGFATACMIF
jgi:hypothetical protein